ncbi:MAG: CocE/NonD family hydrolase [Actinobacteria bacterium]|nr:CocE/NonD family hydrolase [Actinomycetota bacterium]
MEHRRAWIPLADGTRLAARLWVPDERPAAVLLEALPYRMDDLTSSYASEYERLCREGGFAVARVDLRGTGSSEGIAVDEYPPQEQADLAEAIAWLAEQEWSSGRVGMYGTSYSGFNSIQMAIERPPALGAICAIYATDDRYADDVHYTGGALRAIDLVDYVLYMAALTVLPPVPSVFGEAWRDEWLRRIESSEPWLLRWLEEQVDGPYWRHGSLRPGYGRIACPTMLVGGWADGYRNNTFRTFEALQCPKRLLVGPWSHMSTAMSLPGPHIDLVPELVRWFGRWLRDEGNGVDAEPPIQVFVRRSTRPEPDLAEVRGSWRSEPGWPLDRARTQVLRPEPAEGSDELEIRGDLGTSAWISCAGRLPWGQPSDQREDDARSLTYDWEPLDAELEILGHPALAATVVSSAPVAFVSAKLCDVFPDGTSALVARGILNLAQRTSSVEPEPLELGAAATVTVELDATSWVFEAGHRIRLSLAGADWPNIWPPPTPGTLTFDRAALALSLPVVAGEPPVAEPPEFTSSPGTDAHASEPAGEQPPTLWRIERDVLGRETRAVVSHGSSYEGKEGARIDERYEGAVGVSTVDPGAAWARATCRYVIRWPEADCATEARLDLRSDAEAYHVVVDVMAEELGDDVTTGIGRRERRFERTIPRRLQ